MRIRVTAEDTTVCEVRKMDTQHLPKHLTQ